MTMYPQQNNFPGHGQYQYGAQPPYPQPGYPPHMQYPQARPPSQGFGYPGGPFPQYPGYGGQFQQPAYPMPGAYTSAGPPTKRQKGNPVITRYPMPPYSPPTPQGPSPTAPPYNAMQQRHSFAQPSTNPQSGWNAQPTTNFSQPRPVTQPQTGHSYQNPWQPAKPLNQQFPQPIGPPKPGSSGAPSPATTPTVSVTAPGPPKSASSIHSAASVAPKRPFVQMHHDTSLIYEIDFGDDDASRSASIDDVDQKLSLGIITWHPPRPITTPIASTFELAQKDLVSPPAPRKPEESISKYHGPDRKHLLDVNVKDSTDWPDVKDDLIFRLFDAKPTFVAQHAPEDCKPAVDPEAKEFVPQAAKPSSPKTAAAADDDDEAMDMASDDEDEHRPEAKVDSAKSDQTPEPVKPVVEDKQPASTVFDNLEEMLTRSRRGPIADVKPESRSQSRQSSHGSSPQIYEQARSRQASQTAASLSNTPPKTDQHVHEETRAAPPANMGQPLYGLHNIPPPPPLEPTRRTSRGHHMANGSHTPDVDMHDGPPADDTPPKGQGHPALGRTSSTRKRAFDETQGPHTEERRRQEDDLTPRLRRQRQKMEPAYSRR